MNLALQFSRQRPWEDRGSRKPAARSSDNQYNQWWGRPGCAHHGGKPTSSKPRSSWTTANCMSKATQGASIGAGPSKTVTHETCIPRFCMLVVGGQVGGTKAERRERGLKVYGQTEAGFATSHWSYSLHLPRLQSPQCAKAAHLLVGRAKDVFTEEIK